MTDPELDSFCHAFAVDVGIETSRVPKTSLILVSQHGLRSVYAKCLQSTYGRTYQ